MKVSKTVADPSSILGVSTEGHNNSSGGGWRKLLPDWHIELAVVKNSFVPLGGDVPDFDVAGWRGWRYPWSTHVKQSKTTNAKNNIFAMPKAASVYSDYAIAA